MKNLIALLIVLSAFISSFAQTDTLTTKNCVFNKYPPHRDTTNNTLVFRNQQAPLSRKFLRASTYVFTGDAVIYGVLFISPESFSKWDHSKKIDFEANYKHAFTNLPVFDNDYWYINYVGHPYQGAFCYNALRSQGGTRGQSILFTIFHSCIWEYAIEGGVEHPSLQDLLVTPIGGAILGEFCHLATVKMSKNGFKWYEVAFVCVFNPAYVLNNGFKFANPKKQ